MSKNKKAKNVEKINDNRLPMMLDPKFVMTLLQYAKACDPAGVHTGPEQRDMQQQAVTGINKLEAAKKK